MNHVRPHPPQKAQFPVLASLKEEVVIFTMPELCRRFLGPEFSEFFILVFPIREDTQSL